MKNLKNFWLSRLEVKERMKKMVNSIQNNNIPVPKVYKQKP